MKLMSWLSRGCLALWLCSACAPLDDPNGVDQLAAEIVGGVRDRDRHPAVLALLVGDDALCTATLIAPNAVLTARHCVSRTVERILCDSAGRQVLSDLEPSTLSLRSGDEVSRSVELARGSRVLTPNTQRLCEADIAVVLLDRAVRGIAPMRVDLSSLPLRTRTMSAVGFGQRGATARARSGIRYFRERITVLSSSTRELTGSRAVCAGDSGGPAIDPRTGSVVGVLSRGSDPCTASDATAVWTRPAVLRDVLARLL
ncbi:MAG: S1 family peptidase [Deltaproteobacteria bacterium]|nr:S1 family peptidase [Deltaproteobacteria bacterium]